MSLWFSFLKKTIWSILVIGTIGFAYFSYSRLRSAMPLYRLVEKIEANTFGDKYKRYFVDVKDKYNNSWWKWSYEQRLNKNREELSSEFKDVNSDLNLKISCEKAYKGKVEEVDKYKKDVWSYCSILRHLPLTIAEVKDPLEKEYWDASEVKVLKLGRKLKDKVVSVANKDKNNLDFWHYKDLEFFGAKGENGTGYHGKTNGQFKSMFEEWYDQKGKIGRPYVVRGICEAAYQKTNSSESNDRVLAPEEQVLKYCAP